MSGTWIALVIALWVAVILLAIIVLGLIRRVNHLEREARANAEAMRSPQ